MSKIEELFIPYELAAIAKEKGFDKACLSVFVNSELDLIDGGNWALDGAKVIKAPLYQQIISWFKGFRIMICEYPSFGWVIYVDEKEDGIYLQKYANMSLDKAIEEAFKLI